MAPLTFSRRRRQVVSGLLALVFLAFAAASAHAQTDVTMGSLVMRRHADPVAAVPDIGAALQHADPGVRAVAARLTGVGVIVGLRQDLAAALERETVDGVAAEQLRALMMLGVPAALPLVDRTLERAGPATLRTAAEELGFFAAGALIDRLPLLVARLSAYDSTALSGVLLARRRHPEASSDLERAWNLYAPEDQRQALADADKRASGAVPPVAEAPVPLRVFDAVWPGFFASLFEAAGCDQTREWDVGALRLTYSAVGLPTRVSVDPSRVSRECADATTALAYLSYGGRLDRGSVLEWILLPTAEEFVACADGPVPDRTRSPAPDDERGEAEIVEPRKTRNVQPVYPRGAQQAGIQGIVVVEALITDDGCVRSARVVRGIDSAVDFEAIRAVLQWRYTPTLLNGAPVAVEMTVTVNFTLR